MAIELALARVIIRSPPGQEQRDMSAEAMQAIAIRDGAGPASALHAVQLPVPAPRAGEILIRVRAAGVNRPDLLQRTGNYPPPPGAPDTLGLEVAGEVVLAAGRWRDGDKVCALLGGGGYAEYARVDARHALPLPTGRSPSASKAMDGRERPTGRSPSASKAMDG